MAIIHSVFARTFFEAGERGARVRERQRERQTERDSQRHRDTETQRQSIPFTFR